MAGGIGLPNRSQVFPVNPLLTQLAIAYMQENQGWLSANVFPIVNVTSKEGLYPTIPKGSWLLDEAKIRAPGTVAVRGGYTVGSASYKTEQYAYGYTIPTELRRGDTSTMAVDLDTVAVQHILQRIRTRADGLFASKYMTTGIWGIDRTGVSSGPTGTQFIQWDQAASTPQNDIILSATAMLKETGKKPNVLVMGREVWDAIRKNAFVKADLSISQTKIVTEDLFAVMCGLEKVVIAESIYNSAADGQTASMQFRVGKTALLAYSTPTPSKYVATAGYTFSWDSVGLGNSDGYNVPMRSYYEEAAMQDVYEGVMELDHKVVSTDLGTFFTAVVA
jgi:hypothetical protein